MATFGREPLTGAGGILTISSAVAEAARCFVSVSIIIIIIIIIIKNVKIRVTLSWITLQGHFTELLK